MSVKARKIPIGTMFRTVDRETILYPDDRDAFELPVGTLCLCIGDAKSDWAKVNTKHQWITVITAAGRVGEVFLLDVRPLK